MPDLKGMQKRAAAHIKRWGGPGFLIRDGVKRSCFIGKAEYSWKERDLVEEGQERFVVAAPIAIPPEYKLDDVQFAGKLYTILKPVIGERPNGVIVIKYIMDVKFAGNAT